MAPAPPAHAPFPAWRHNRSGQCDVPAPNPDFVAVAAGADHSLGLKADAPCPRPERPAAVVAIEVPPADQSHLLEHVVPHVPIPHQRADERPHVPLVLQEQPQECLMAVHHHPLSDASSTIPPAIGHKSPGNHGPGIPGARHRATATEHAPCRKHPPPPPQEPICNAALILRVLRRSSTADGRQALAPSRVSGIAPCGAGASVDGWMSRSIDGRAQDQASRIGEADLPFHPPIPDVRSRARCLAPRR